MASTKMSLRPFPVPDHVTVVMPPRPRQEGMQALPTIPIEAIELDVLEDLAFEWLNALFASRGKRNPFQLPPKAAPRKVP